MRRQGNLAQMKEENRTLDKERSDTEIANLSDAEFKTLVIRMLRELTEYGKNIREEMKVILSEIKKYPQGTHSEGKGARIQINDLKHKEEINIQPEQKEETRIQKNEASIKRLWVISKHPNLQIIQMPEEKRKSNKLKTFLKK